MVILWAVGAYICGAAPWSVWLGRLFYHVDPRQQRDHNPGAANAYRAAGWKLGAAVLILDFLKAAISVAAARWLAGFSSWDLFWVALAPPLGHSFSIFLRFRGGRGIAAIFGVWAWLTLYAAPLVMGIAVTGATLATRNDELRTVAIPLALFTYLLITRAPGWMLLLALLQTLVLAIKIGAYLIERRGQPHTGAP